MSPLMAVIVGYVLDESFTEPTIAELAVSEQLDSGDQMMKSSVRTGRYRHFKGNEYIVVGVARHSETQEELVVYRQDYGERGLWVRPLAMFGETVEVDGRQLPRFEYLGPEHG